MTEKLKDLMDEVTGMVDHEFAVPDLDTIVHDGNRTVRRRRALVGIGGLVAAVAVGAAVLGAGGLGADEARVADTPVDSDGMSWAVGSTLHTPTSSIDVGHPVRAYVRTTAGYVATDDDGRVWSVVGEDVVEVGQMEPSSLYLTSDTEDSLAAWLEHEPDGEWSWIVFDQELGQRSTIGGGKAPDLLGVVVALDDRHLYVSQGSDYVSLDVDNGTESVIDSPVRAAQLLSVEDGVFAWADPGDDDGESEYIVGRTGMEPVRITWVRGFQAVFSPDAHWVSFDADEPRVFDVATGERVEIDIDGRGFGVGYEWLDEDTLAVLASRSEAGPIEVLACEVPEGGCDAVAPDLGSFASAGENGFALPLGTAVDD